MSAKSFYDQSLDSCTQTYFALKSDYTMLLQNNATMQTLDPSIKQSKPWQNYSI